MDRSATSPPGDSSLPLRHRKPGLTLYLYTAREALRPFLFGLVGLTLIVLTRDLIVFSELIINRGIGADQVALIAFFEAVPVAAEIYPFAVLIGALVALGRLGADREILALEASGVAAPRLVWPIACFAAITGVVSVVLSLWGVPSAGRTLDATLERIGRQQPWANFRTGVVNRFGGWQVEAREVSAQGDVLRGVLLWSPDVGETIFAAGGRVAAAPDGSVALTLDDGTLVLSARGGAQQLRFEAMVTELPGSDQPIARAEEKRIQSLSLEDLWIAAHALASGLILVSNNLREFSRVTGLAAENWAH